MNKTLQDKIDAQKAEYDSLKHGKEDLLRIIAEAELPEGVYNSNAIENSTLTLKETEKILLEMEVERNVDLREVFEAKNLARVEEYVRKKSVEEDMTQETLLTLHAMLLTNIDDSIAGRFRGPGEYVRVGTHIAPAPEQVEQRIEEALVEFAGGNALHTVDRVARFHLRFEYTHPFNDGNGRVGRLLMNYQFQRLGFPPTMIRFDVRQEYYRAFRDFDDTGNTKKMEKIVGLALSESLNKRNAYLRGATIIAISEYAKKYFVASNAILNKAKRQTIPAFREKGVWKIAADYSEQ